MHSCAQVEYCADPAQTKNGSPFVYRLPGTVSRSYTWLLQLCNVNVPRLREGTPARQRGTGALDTRRANKRVAARKAACAFFSRFRIAAANAARPATPSAPRHTCAHTSSHAQAHPTTGSTLLGADTQAAEHGAKRSLYAGVHSLPQLAYSVPSQVTSIIVLNTQGLSTSCIMAWLPAYLKESVLFGGMQLVRDVSCHKESKSHIRRQKRLSLTSATTFCRAAFARSDGPI